MGATFGATAAAARLLGLDVKQAAHAIALTATSIGGLSKAAATSIAREYHAGLATLLGIEAALAARRGFTGELAILAPTVARASSTRTSIASAARWRTG